MSYFYWNSSFEVRHPRIDEQHQRLIEHINTLAEAFASDSALPELNATLQRLRDYAAEHFAEEETAMAASAMPAELQEAHRSEHCRFLQRVDRIGAERDLRDADVTRQILEFLTTWLVSHILHTDHQMAPYLGGSVPAQRAEADPLLQVSRVERTLLGALNEGMRRFRVLSEEAPVMIWASDGSGRRTFHNLAWETFAGTAPSGQAPDWEALVHPEDRKRYRQRLAQLHASPAPGDIEYRARGASGRYYHLLERVLPRHGADGVFMGLIACTTDISTLKQAEQVLRHARDHLEKEVARRTEQITQIMLTDPLTGVGNRRYLMDHLGEEVARAVRYQRLLALIFIDIDHFKRVNDEHGHHVGDQVLVAIAATCRETLRAADLVGRFGGEEFVVLLPETDRATAIQAAERIRAAVAGLELPGLDARMTISAGVTQWQEGDDVDALLRRGDEALYRAKRGGRNRVETDLSAAPD